MEWWKSFTLWSVKKEQFFFLLINNLFSHKRILLSISKDDRKLVVILKTLNKTFFSTATDGCYYNNYWNFNVKTKVNKKCQILYQLSNNMKIEKKRYDKKVIFSCYIKNYFQWGSLFIIWSVEYYTGFFFSLLSLKFLIPSPIFNFLSLWKRL